MQSSLISFSMPVYPGASVQQQRDHHRRIVRRPAMPVIAIVRIKRPQIELRDGIDHTPRQVALGQPLAQTRRQQQLLITVTRDEVLRHPGILLIAADGTPLLQQPPWKASAVAWRMSPAPRRVKSVAGGRDVEADGCGHDEGGGAEFCD
jgi:hypothetical protein